ncbi:hypothetical protein [Streptomyces sp. NBC_00347]|nr:hypothetical protein [Streptomyces sp. NBC_00347]MCX5129349.1 hypothetical protein [Streptomyces sp. NBC_00347]
MGFGFALCLIGPAMAVSAAGRRRAQVVGATIAIGAVGFAVNFIALAWSPAAPLRFLSPFHSYAPGDALAEGGVLWPRLGILVGTVQEMGRQPASSRGHLGAGAGGAAGVGVMGVFVIAAAALDAPAGLSARGFRISA